MRKNRGWFAAATAAVLLVIPQATTADAGSPQPGGRILYLEFTGSTGDPGALKSVRPDGQGGQNIGKQLNLGSWPDYSPDGRRIAYTEEFDFRSMAADGSDDRWLVSGPSGAAYPHWSPDGRWIAGESGGSIWAVHRDGHEAGWVNLTGEHDSFDLVPSWAPSGRRLATTTIADVRIYSADGTQLRKIIPLPGAYRLDWNPRGGMIAVEALGDLWLLTPATGAVRRLTNTPDIQEISPVWSPDGSRLAFGRGPGTYNPDHPGRTTAPVIWLMDANGANRHSTGVLGVPTSWRTAA